MKVKMDYLKLLFRINKTKVIDVFKINAKCICYSLLYLTNLKGFIFSAYLILIMLKTIYRVLILINSLY